MQNSALDKIIKFGTLTQLNCFVFIKYRRNALKLEVQKMNFEV